MHALSLFPWMYPLLSAFSPHIPYHRYVPYYRNLRARILILRKMCMLSGFIWVVIPRKVSLPKTFFFFRRGIESKMLMKRNWFLHSDILQERLWIYLWEIRTGMRRANSGFLSGRLHHFCEWRYGPHRAVCTVDRRTTGGWYIGVCMYMRWKRNSNKTHGRETAHRFVYSFHRGTPSYILSQYYLDHIFRILSKKTWRYTGNFSALFVH